MTKSVNELTKEQLTEVVSRQMYLQRTADIAYQSFHLNISENDFFKIYLWQKLGLNDFIDESGSDWSEGMEILQ